MAFYFSRENYRNIVRGSTLSGSAVISTVNTGVTGQNDDEIDRGLTGAITGLTPPSILSFYTIPTQVSWGQPVSVFWTTANAVSVSLNNAIGDVTSYGVSSGRYDVERLEQPTTYELTATNSSGSVKKYAIVGMQTLSPVFNHFYADPNDVLSGQGFTLYWSIQENPTNVTISGIGDVTSYGASEGQYRVTSITQSTIYTATATNAFGSRTKTASVSIRQPEVVPPPVIWSFYANPQNTAGTGRTTLQWAVSNNPTSISISPDIGSLSPSATSVQVTGITDNKSYTLTVSNTGGSATRSTTVVFGSTDAGNAGSTFATDFPGTNSLVSVADMKNKIRNNMSVWFNMDGQVTTVNPGARAMGFYGDDPSFTWFRFVNGNYKGNSGEQIVDAAGNTIDPYNTLRDTSLKEWYKWGARRFSIHLPFGKVAAGGGRTERHEILNYQPDSYLNARDGLRIDGVTCNEPMPWLVGDFVKTFKALTSGTQGTLTNQEWNILTGNTGWFNPAEPINLLFYNGSINQENYVRWKPLGFTGAKQRLIDSFEPYLQAGAKVGLDALVASPGPTVGINMTQALHEYYLGLNAPSASPFNNPYADGTTYGPTLDAAWWNFYSTWLIPNFGVESIFCEAAPQAFKIGNTWYDSPYIDHPFITDDEYFYNAYGNETESTIPTRIHKLSELGQVEAFFAPFQGIRKYPIVGVSGPSGFTFGRYWYLRDYAAPAYYYNSGGGTVAEMDGDARVYRVVESTGYGNIQWDYAWTADKLLNKNTGKYDDPKLDETINSAYLNWSNYFNSTIENQGEGGAYTNIGGVEDFRSRFPTIDDYAHYLAFLKSGGTPVPRGFSTGYRHPETRVDPNKIIDHTKLLSFGLKNNGIENAIWIYLDELDSYTNGKLNGISGGQLYRPSITADVEPKRIKDYLDYRYERAKETLGYYPKYFVFSLSKNDGSTQPSQFQMERYLYTPATYPNTSDYSQYESAGGLPCYDDSPPTVLDIDQNITPDNKDVLLSTGYLTSHSDYLLTVNLINKLLQTCREWKTESGYDVNFGVENLPDVTKQPRTSYLITGGGTGITFERTNEWGATQWYRAEVNGGSSLLGELATVSSKNRVLLEFSKRIEPILPYLDVLYPTVYDYYTSTDAYDARYKSYQKTKINLAKTLKSAPYSFSGDVIPLVSYSHVGNIEGASASNLDPIAASGGTTYDDAQVYSDIIDWVRTDHGNTVEGYAFWNDTSYAASAMGISSYVGITADRERVYKWIKSFDGAGVTIDWTNSVDVEAKIKRFYDIHSELLKRYAYRFGGESLQQPVPNTPKLKILMQGLYHPSNGNGIVQNVYDTGISYDSLDVVPAKIFYLYNQLGISGICYGTGRYTFVSPWGNPSGPGLNEPFQNDVPGNTLTASYVNTLALTQGRTADYESAATELLRLRFLNMDQTYDGEILKWRADEHPPLGNERLSYTGYIFPDPEIIKYPAIGKFQTAGETFHVETCRFLNKIVYNATKQVWPQSKVGFWGECQADSEPFNDYNTRWDDFVQNPATYGAGFVDNNGVSLTVTGLTGYVNYVAEKLKYIYENSCDVVSPNFYQLYGGLSGQNPLVEDIHYGQISSLWNSSTGDKIVNSRTRTYADVSLKLIKKMNELLISEGKSRKEVYPTIWNYHLVGNQFGIDLPSTTPHGCGITFGLTADRADSMYSLRKFMEQNLGISGSTYTFWNLGHFMPNGPTCDSINLVRRRHPELVPVDRDEYYSRFIRPSIESGVVDGFYQWNSTTRYDFTYAARSKAELTALGLLNLGDSFDSRSNIAVETIYQRRFLLNEVLGLCMAGLTYGAYFNNPNEFPGATQAGFSFDTWGQYNNIGHPASKFTRHKFSDYILNHYCKYWADTAISQGILQSTPQQNPIDFYLWTGFASSPDLLQRFGNIDGAFMSTGVTQDDLAWYNTLKSQGFKFITSIVDGDGSTTGGLFPGHPTVITGGAADWQGIANWLNYWHGLSGNHPEEFYVSLNFELDYKDRILRGLDPVTDLQDDYSVGVRGLCGPNNQAAVQELSDVFDNLKNFFGSNLKLSFWGLPFIQPAYHVGIGDFFHRDPGGISGNIQTWGKAWYDDQYGAGVDIQNRIETAAIQFQGLAPHADFMNTIQYEIVPTVTAITGSIARPVSLVLDRGNGSPAWDCGKAVCDGATIDQNRTYLAYRDQALAGISSAKRINQLNGSTKDIMPTYSLTYYGIPYYYGTDESVPDNEGFWYQYIPLDDTLTFFNVMRSQHPDINKVALFDSEYGRKVAFIRDGRINGGSTAADNANIQAVYGAGADVDMWRRYRVSLRDTYIRHFFGGNPTGINFDTNSANDPARGLETTNLRKYIANLFNSRLITMKNMINNTT